MKTLKWEKIYSKSYRDIEHLRLNRETFIGQYRDGDRVPAGWCPCALTFQRDREKPHEPVQASTTDDITLGVL